MIFEFFVKILGMRVDGISLNTKSSTTYVIKKKIPDIKAFLKWKVKKFERKIKLEEIFWSLRLIFSKLCNLDKDLL